MDIKHSVIPGVKNGDYGGLPHQCCGLVRNDPKIYVHSDYLPPHKCGGARMRCVFLTAQREISSRRRSSSGVRCQPSAWALSST